MRPLRIGWAGCGRFAGMDEPQPAPPRRRARWALAFAAGFAVAIGVGLALHDRLPGVPVEPAAAPESAELVPGSAEVTPPTVIVTSTSPEQPLPPFATLHLERSAFSASGPVRVSLGLAEPSADADPRPVHLLSIDDERVFSTEGRLDGERSVATIEIDSEWLRPGSYLVQMKTTERSHFPLRRYVIVVR